MAPSDEPSRSPCPTHDIPSEGEGDRGPVETPSPSRLEVLLWVVVAVLAFLLASFPARNSDLWTHLAAGRDLIGWPFSGTAPGFSTTWLSDLLFFVLHSVFGGPGLVLVKALLVVGLALVLLRLSRTERGWWLAIVGTVLALLAMSTRLLLQPATLSYVLLALTLWFLWRRDQTAANQKPSPLPPWPLVLLFLIWANLDRWFVLGLLTVALVWLGRTLDLARHADRQTGSKGVRAFFGFLFGRTGVLLVCLSVLGAVCLLNPSGVFAFTLPAELGWFGSRANLDPAQVTSPFGRAYLVNLGQSPAGLAYFPLLGLGLLSFLVNLPRWHWERFLPWVALAVLSAMQVRVIPFFAVVAGPVLAWNLQDFFARHTEAERSHSPLWRGWLRAGDVLTLVLGLAFLVCAWPGWLQSPPFEPRRWVLEPPPSLERGAAATRRWHQEGKLSPEMRGLHLSRESAQLFAWFCPEEKGVVDDPIASAILGVAGAPEDWAERMRAAGINHVMVYEADRGRLFAALERLLGDPEQWPLLYQEGDLAVFGWRDPSRRREFVDQSDPFQGWELNLNQLAFRPAPDRRVPRAQSDAAPRSRRWWDAFWKPAPPRQLDRDEATLHLLHAEALRRSAPQRHLAVWEASQTGALLGAAGSWGAGPVGLLDAHRRLVLLQPLLPQPGSGVDSLPAPDRMAHVLQRRFTQQRDDVPPALLYLAVRAARRALVVNPEDAQAHLLLGESYLRLLNGTRERVWGRQLPELVLLRRAQASAALNQALARKPDLAQAHLGLGGLYRDMGYLDLALHHLRTYLKLVREAGPPSGVSREQFRKQQAQFEEQELSWLSRTVAEQEKAYAQAASGLKVLDRARLASERGLAGKARDLLLETDVAAFGLPGMLLELELLLGTGRAKDVWDWILPEHRDTLGMKPYHWLRIQSLAALGDYTSAQEECSQLAVAGRGDAPGGPREVMALLVGRAILEEQPGAESLPRLHQRAVRRFEFDNRIAGLTQNLRQEADVTVLRGLLALEEGAVEEAEVAFRLALDFWKDSATADSGGGLEFNGRILAQTCLEWLEQAE